MLATYSITIFLSAALLFLVQPMFAKMVLPMLGGSPAVWNTALLFYQGTLLAGYAYAHASTRLLAPRTHAVVHLALLCLPLALLPIAIPAGWLPPTETHPGPWLLLMMLVAVGLPFFVVSTTSPVLQKWLAATRHPSARDPYFLYAASNAGSLLGLLSYPLLVEPNFEIETQSLVWSVGYALLVLCGAACAASVWRSGGAGGEARHDEASLPPGAGGDDSALTGLRRTRWVLLAFVPSSFMLGVTSYITSDLAAVPLLWVIPLSLYLLSFILVFSRRRLIPHGFILRALPIGLVALVLALLVGAAEPLVLLGFLHLSVFFLVAMACHGELARDRPPTRDLTEFYLWISIGGVLGGLFNALIAPAVFNTLVEYPVTIVMAAMAAMRLNLRSEPRRELILDVVFPVAAGVLTLGLILAAAKSGFLRGPHAAGAIFAAPVVVCFLFSRRPLRFGLALAMVMLAGTFHTGEEGRVLHSERSFFGLHKVTTDPEGKFHSLVHGKTIHGMQHREEALRWMPLTYYHPTGPIGHVFALYGDRLEQPVGVVGLGTGSLASYGRPGQEWDFYEIDPVVVRIARDSGWFTFLRDTKAEARIILGDARISLRGAAEGRYGILVLDAYSSDSIPLHLLTLEAIDLYLSRLAPGGLIAFHVSNLHIDLKPVLANLARERNLVALAREDMPLLEEEEAEGKRLSQWVVLARDLETVAPLVRAGQWIPIQGDAKAPLWTDRFSSILRVLDWGRRED